MEIMALMVVKRGARLLRLGYPLVPSRTPPSGRTLLNPQALRRDALSDYSDYLFCYFCMCQLDSVSASIGEQQARGMKAARGSLRLQCTSGTLLCVHLQDTPRSPLDSRDRAFARWFIQLLSYYRQFVKLVTWINCWYVVTAHKVTLNVTNRIWMEAAFIIARIRTMSWLSVLLH